MRILDTHNQTPLNMHPIDMGYAWSYIWILILGYSYWGDTHTEYTHTGIQYWDSYMEYAWLVVTYSC